MRQPLLLLFLMGALGSVHAQTTFTSTQSGDWDDGATYGNTSPGVQGTDWPATTDNLVVASGHTVTLTDGETINDLTINVGGVLDDDNQGDITVNGNLVINGTVTGSKNIQFTGGGGESIDGTGVHNSSKDLVVNGDASIASGANLTIISNINISGSATVTNNGTVTINTDLKGASSIWVNASNSSVKVGKNLTTGTLTATASGNTVTYSRDGAQSIKDPTSSTYYNLTISGTGTKILLSELTISGDLTISSGTLDTDLYNLTIGGDFSNTSDFIESTNTVTFNGSGTQTITNSSGATFYDLTINKSTGTLVLANDVIASNTLTMTAGITDAGTNKLTLGTGTGNEGTYAYTAGQIKGQFERWIANTSTSTDIDFPVGTDDDPRIATLNFAGITTGGTVIFQFVESAPGNAGLSLFDVSATIYNTFVDGYWDMDIDNSFDLGANNFDLDMSGTGFTAFTIDAITRLLTRSTDTDDWTVEGTHAPAVDPIAKRTVLSTMPAQYAFGDELNCTGPTTSAITGSTDVCTSDTGDTYFVTDNSNTYNWTITGGSQVSGGTTASITVDWGSAGQVGNVKVVETNGCTSGEAVNLAVNINSIPPSSITGKTSVPESATGEPYSVIDLGYTYTWTITGSTADPTPATGQGTSSITVDWDVAGVGNVSVIGQNAGCAAAPAVDSDVLKYIVINSAQDGDWGTSATWSTGTVPLASESVRILNTNDITLSANEQINNLVIDAGGTLTSASQTMTVDGDLTVNGTYTGGTKQLILDGINTVIDGTGTISVTGQDIDITSGSKTIAATAVLTISNGNLDIGAGLSVTNNGNLTVADDIIGTNSSTTWTNAANSTLKAGSGFLATGILNSSASGNTVEYNGTGAQDIKTPSSSNYYHLTLGTSGVKTALASLNIDGDLSITGTSELDVNANSSDLAVAGNWSNAGGTFTEGSQTVTLDGSSSQTITNTAGETFYDLIVNNSSSGITLAASSPITISNQITLTDGIIDARTNSVEVIVNDNATAIGSTVACFVQGDIRKIGDDAFIFPVGDGSIWARIGISAPGNTTDSFTAEYTDGAHSDESVTGVLNNASRIEYWNLDRTAGTSNIDVTLYWESAGRSGIDDYSTDLVVAHYDGTDWESLGQSSITGSDPGNVTVNSVSTFSPFTFGSESGGNNPLPVELLSFKGSSADDKVVLTWETGSEINNDRFEIQRSFNGNEFENIGTMPGMGNSNLIVEYSFTDKFPGSGINYYRLQQIDFDGGFEFSKIIGILVQDIGMLPKMKVYPNPFIDQKLRIETHGIVLDEDSYLRILDIGGNELVFHNVQNFTTGELEIESKLVSSLSPGVYVLQLFAEGRSFTTRLVKQDRQ